MLTITRRQFNLGLQEGVRRAGELLSPEDVQRIQRVGMNAVQASNNFAPQDEYGRLNVGCPASQANLPDNDNGAAWDFACGFDDYMGGLFPNMQYAVQGGRIEIV